jgi:hypothetical protein
MEPARERPRRSARLTKPEPDTVSAAEFEQMKRDIAEEETEPRRRTSTLTERLAHSQDDDDGGTAGGPEGAWPPRVTGQACGEPPLIAAAAAVCGPVTPDARPP